MSDATANEVVRRWNRHPRCVGLARAELRATLARWGLSPLDEPAVLILSELLTNAGRHARVPSGREIETRFLTMDGGLRIEVHDASSVLPSECAPDLDASGGRGLLLVAANADRWGFAERSGPGKVVWAELGLTSVAGGGALHGW